MIKSKSIFGRFRIYLQVRHIHKWKFLVETAIKRYFGNDTCNSSLFHLMNSINSLTTASCNRSNITAIWLCRLCFSDIWDGFPIKWKLKSANITVRCIFLGIMKTEFSFVISVDNKHPYVHIQEIIAEMAIETNTLAKIVCVCKVTCTRLLT